MIRTILAARRSVARAALFVCLVSAVCAAPRKSSNSHAKEPARPSGPCSIVVLDFPMAPREVETRDENRVLHKTTKEVTTEKGIRGWWGGSQDLYINANMGRIAADLYSEALEKSGSFQVYSRNNLKYFYADKKDLLKDKLKLDDKQADKAILELDPVAVGRELGVGKVVVGKITDSELRRSRFSGYFTTAVSYSVCVYDVATGKQVFCREIVGVKGTTTQYKVYEDNAKQFVDQLVSGE